MLCVLDDFVVNYGATINFDRAIMNHIMGVAWQLLGCVTSQSTSPNENALEIPLESLGIMQVDITIAFMFETLPGNYDESSATEWSFESVGNDVSELFEPESCSRNQCSNNFLGWSLVVSIHHSM